MGKAIAEDTQLEAAIRAAIEADGRPLNELGRVCGLSSGMMSRFVRRERGLSLAAAGRLAAALGLKLAPAAPVKSGRRK